MPRLFVAVSLPREVVQDVALTQGGIRGARWEAPEKLLVPIAFFGEVDASLLERIADTLEDLESPAFKARIQGCGVFPHRGPPRMLWMGVDQPRCFASLRQQVLQTLRPVPCHTDDRKYHPHVTLARLSRCTAAHLHRWIEGHNFYRSAAFDVDALTLCSTRLNHPSARFTVEARYPLTPSAGEREDEFVDEARLEDLDHPTAIG